jgi:lipoate-protein ligase A
VLHHGTLLFDAELDMLDKALAGHEEFYSDKAVRSVRKNVVNIRELLKEDVSPDVFHDLFRIFIMRFHFDAYEDKLDLFEHEAILKLVEEKYKTFHWNFGYSPEYHYDNKWEAREGKFSVSLLVKDGLIYKAEINGPEKYSSISGRMKEQLAGVPHEKIPITERLKNLTFANENESQLLNQIIQHLF